MLKTFKNEEMKLNGLNNQPVLSSSTLTKIFQVSSQQADLILRLALGLVFVAHGAQKLFGWFGGYGWTGTVGFFNQALGIAPALAGLAILIEFFGGIAIILGLLTRPAALGLAVTMLVAAVKVHLANGFFLDQKGAADGVEYIFVLFLLSLYLLIKGAGTISLDKVIKDRLTGKTS
ncbi:MAG: DoxX family protein [Carboxydocellales bacterium]